MQKICTVCKEKKEPLAFVGERSVCRLCWLYVPESEKKLLVREAQRKSSYDNNKREWEKEKAKKSQAQVSSLESE